MSSSRVKSFEIDILPFYKVLVTKYKRYSKSEFECKPCDSVIPLNDVIRHVFYGHKPNHKVRIRRLTVKSDDGSHFVCLCGHIFLSYDIIRFVIHFDACLGAKKVSASISKVIDTFKMSDTYECCNELTEKIYTKLDSPDNPSNTEDEKKISYIDKLKKNIIPMDTIENHLDYLFKIKKSSLEVEKDKQIVTYRKHAHGHLRNHVSQYLYEHISQSGIICKHCDKVVNSLKYISHVTTQHLETADYGIETIICPNCSTFVCRLIYASGYHYACMLIHIVECIMATQNIEKNVEHYDTFVRKFNLICLRFATHSPYVINKTNPYLETKIDKFFSMEELLNTTRPGNDGSMDLGKETLQRMFNLGDADLRDNVNDYKRVCEDITLSHTNGVCDICNEDIKSIKARMKADTTVTAKELLTREEFLQRYTSNNIPNFIRPSGKQYIEPIQDISGLKLYMIEIAARLPNCNPKNLPENIRDTYLCAAHVYIFRLKATSTFRWLDNNKHRVFVVPNSTLCWSENKKAEVDYIDELNNVHRHLILIFDNYSTFEEFAAKDFESESALMDIYNKMLETNREGSAKKHKPKTKLCKLIYSPQHLFGAIIYVSRFKIPDNSDWEYIYNPYLREFGDTCKDKSCDHHEMTLLMSRHAKPISYSLYRDGLSDWYMRANIYKEILWLAQAFNVKTFDKSPTFYSENIIWPVRSDLSKLYIPLAAAKSVLPGYISNHSINLVSYDDPHSKEAIDYLRSFGGILLQSNTNNIYAELEYYYIQLSQTCAKRIMKYIYTITERTRVFSDMLLYNSAATDTILKQKKLLDQYNLILSKSKKTEAETYAYHIDQVRKSFVLKNGLDNIYSEITSILVDRPSYSDVVNRLRNILRSKANFFNTDQMTTIAEKYLEEAKGYYLAESKYKSAEIEAELIARHLAEKYAEPSTSFSTTI
nr:MAG: hypothetical protein [Apis mellifra filamentous-like virus]